MSFVHHGQLAPAVLDELFRLPPEEIRSDDRELLAVALGASLYVPAVRDDLVGCIRRRAAEGVRSLILDLEDAVADHQVDAGLDALVAALDTLADDPPPAALFVRIRRPGHLDDLHARLGRGREVLTGVVLPKFDAATGGRVLDRVGALGDSWGRRLYAMPVLETPALLHRRTRAAELDALAEVFAERRDLVLALRIGATDLCGRLGIRRGPDHTIYDVRVVADVLADVVGVFGRHDGTGFVVTGTVWEYFPAHGRMLRAQLRESPFTEHGVGDTRTRIVRDSLDGLVREVLLDAVNGITGKSVIHPSHVGIVHALSVVTSEEYDDALDVVGDGSGPEVGGVLASGHGNKMNERGPHGAWAERTLTRARAFGVAAPGVSTADLLAGITGR